MINPISPDYELSWRTIAKQLGKDYGRASDTIHRLRADIALLRNKDPKMMVDMYLQQRRENDELRGELEGQRQILIRERRKADTRV